MRCHHKHRSDSVGFHGQNLCSGLHLRVPISSNLPSLVLPRILPTRRPQFSPLSVHCCASSDGGGGRSRGGGGGGDDDSFGFYLWNGDSAIHWESEERVTLFTTEGLIHIGGSVVPRRVASSKRSHRYRESDYMDPKRQIYLGALFDIAATNGLDMGRRLCLFGYCSSIEMLSDIVEDTVMENGGEVVAAEKASEGGLQEKLTMKVAVPLLWGVPPASETLHLAVRSGGGIIDKVCLQWDYL
ncbi:hypothetical protein Scep_015475 [Stephania cephalantha]|uniref:DUF7811 domain-containing protein n=1 Tax=Stephania cephalantha TaxID=152367 RepID=A0AAP0J388_9MAGN